MFVHPQFARASLGWSVSAAVATSCTQQKEGRQKMKNPLHAQHFSDVDVNQFGYGGLGGAGAEGHDRATAKPTAEGVKVALNCDNCGSPNILTIEWPEAIIISAGRLPPNWKVDQGYIRPEVGCANCRRLVTPGVTPDEAQRWVKAGINARFVDPKQAQGIVDQVRGMR